MKELFVTLITQLLVFYVQSHYVSEMRIFMAWESLPKLIPFWNGIRASFLSR